MVGAVYWGFKMAEFEIDILRTERTQVGMCSFPTLSQLAEIKAAGFDHLVTLCEDQEFTEFSKEDFASESKAVGLEWSHQPVKDMDVPGNTGIKDLTYFIHAKSPCIHCMAGMGRTGTVVAAYLMDHFEVDAQEAIECVREVRGKGAIESAMQVSFLQSYS